MPKIHRSFHARNRSPIRAAIRPAICSQFRAESARLPGPLSRTIGATMQPAPSTPSTQPHVLALRLRGEKPHQGLRSKNPAPYRVRNRCNLRNALGLRAGCAGNRVRSFCSSEQFDSDLGLYYLRARYYNPATGRFLSRDPEDGVAKDPASLHKYLYAGGDPVNFLDPTGRTLVDDAVFDGWVILRFGTIAAIETLEAGGAQFAAYVALYAGYAYLTIPQLESIISQLLVTDGEARALGCATVALMMDRTMSEDDPTPYGLGSAALNLMYGAACYHAPSF